MPYVTAEQRAKIDPEIRSLAQAITRAFGTPETGVLNYAVTKLVVELLRPDAGYGEMSRFRAALLDAAEEFYRRKMAPYEDAKRDENGDVY